MTRYLHIALGINAIALISACGSQGTTKPVAEEVPEIHPGILMGYLPMEEPLDSKAFVPAAPAGDSPRQAMDDAVVARMLALRGSPRWELAVRDARLEFPGAAFVSNYRIFINRLIERDPLMQIASRWKRTSNYCRIAELL